MRPVIAALLTLLLVPRPATFARPSRTRRRSHNECPHVSVRGARCSYDVAMPFAMPFVGKKARERRRQKREAKRSLSSAEKSAQPAKSDGDAPYDRKAAHKMRQGLQKALKRPVILPDERRRDLAIRTVKKNRRIILGLGALGVGIASVVTAGAAGVGLAIGAACIPALDPSTFFGTGGLDPNESVTLERGAVARLLEMKDAAKQLAAVQKAINAKPSTGPDRRVTLSDENIKAAVAPATQPEPSGRIEPVRAGAQLGFNVIGAGLLLLALILIPQDIHGLMTRAASAILVVGALIVGAAVVNGRWLKGIDGPGHEERPSPD